MTPPMIEAVKAGAEVGFALGLAVGSLGILIAWVLIDDMVKWARRMASSPRKP